MARKPRLEWAGASYHVMARGNERVRIFRCEADYLLFMETLQESLSRFGIELHAWVLMPNHYHLAASTPRGNLSRWMAWLQTTFTARYNRRHKRVGHLFQGRYRAELVDEDAYARHLILYIHLNPIRSRKSGRCEFIGGIKELAGFRWNGHLDLAGKRKNPLVSMSVDWTHYWSRNQNEVSLSYLKAIGQSLGDAPGDWKLLVERGLVAGGKKMQEKVFAKLQANKNKESLVWRKPEEWQQNRKKLESLLKKETDRGIIVWVKVRLQGEKGIEVARELGYKDGSGVTQALKRIERQRRQDKLLASKLKRYEAHSIFKG